MGAEQRRHPGPQRGHLSDGGRSSGWDDAEVERAPICPECGVTALMADVFGADGVGYVCENPDCEQFGEIVPTA